MKLTKYVLAVVLFCNFLTACSTDQSDEEEALFLTEYIHALDPPKKPPVGDNE